MTNKTRTHATEKSSATVRKPPTAARALRHLPGQVHPAMAFQRAMSAPAWTLSPAEIFALQRTAGNRAVEQILAERARHEQHQHQSRLTVQAKLSVGAADDPYEREADRIAAEVVQTAGPSVPNIQRQASQEEDEEEKIQAKPLASSITPLIQRQEMADKKDEEDEEETLVQRRVAGAPARVGPSIERDIARARSGGELLPVGLRARMEQALGADFSGVRVHADSESDSLNRSLQSRAFTTGQDLFFKSGEYDPASRRGQELIAHELTHVVQQNSGATGKRGLFVQRNGHDAIYGPLPGEPEEERPRGRSRDGLREEPEEEQASVSLRERISKGLEEDRMTWKMMSKAEKAAMVAVAPAVTPFIDWVTSSYDAGTGAYKYLAGRDPGWPRKVGSAVAGIIAGAVVLASGYGILKGLLRGIALGIGNPLYSIGKRVKALSFNEDIRGIYYGERAHGNLRVRGREENYNYLTNTELLNYALLGGGGLAAVGSFATRTGVDVTGQGWEGFISSKITPLSDTGQALSGLGAGSGLLGAAASFREAKGAYDDLRSGGYTGGQRALGYGQVASSGASAFQQLGTTAYHISNLAGSEFATFAAQSATGGLAAVTGGVDVLRGTYGFFKARQNIEKLKRLKASERLDATTMKGTEQAAAAQASKRNTSAMTFLKGGVTAAGGVLLALSTATPIGWVLLSAGALVGGLFAIWKWWDKRKRKKAIASREFGIEDKRKRWEKDVERVKDVYWAWSKEGKAERAALGPDPLDVELKERGFKDASHYYAYYITNLANNLYDRAGLERTNLESYIITEMNRRGRYAGEAMTPSKIKTASYKELAQFMRGKGINEDEMDETSGKHYKVIEALFEGMGLKFVWKGRDHEPTAEKIGKALDS